jgi:phage/plasmid-associated DNA primase
MNNSSLATQIIDRIGPAVLIQIPSKEKGPRLKEWQKLTLADMTPAYLQGIIPDQNVGVVLGRASGGLVTIDCDSNEYLEEFLQFNPDLKSSLISKAQRGGNIWLRMGSEYPVSSKIKTTNGMPWGEFRADGNQTVIWGTHPSGVKYENNKLPPLGIPFESISWPAGLYLPWKKTPTETRTHRKGSINSSLSVISRARAYVSKMPEAIEGGGGSDSTFAVAKVLKHDFALSDTDALQLMHEYNTRCIPPWSQKELQHKLEDAKKCTRAKRKKGELIQNHQNLIPSPVSTSDSWQEIFSAVERKYGPPFILGRGNEPTGLNPDFPPAVYSRRSCVIHDSSHRALYEYDSKSGLWVRKTADIMKRQIADLIFEIGDHLSCSNIAAKERTDARLNGTLNTLRGMTDGRFNDRPKGIIHCLNGMLDVKTGKLHPFDPSFKSRNQSPFHWKEGAVCHRFLSELLQPALSEDDIKALQLYAGLALMGRNLSQVIAVLTGTPGGGKSQVCNVIEGLIGRENCTQLRTENLTERFELARFTEKTLLTGKDVPGNFLMNRGAHVIKSLSGGDALSTEIKGTMGSDTFDGEFAIIVTSNCRLRVRLDGDSGAWRRRLILINYERPKTDTPIPDFARMLLNTEGPGILCWAVEGARELVERNYKFPISVEQQSRVDSLLDESDALSSFVRSQIQTSDAQTLATNEITEAFFEFCKSRNWVASSLKEVERDLPDAMMEIHRAAKSNSIERHGKHVKGYRGVRLLNSNHGTDGTDDFDPHIKSQSTNY